MKPKPRPEPLPTIPMPLHDTGCECPECEPDLYTPEAIEREERKLYHSEREE